MCIYSTIALREGFQHDSRVRDSDTFPLFIKLYNTVSTVRIYKARKAHLQIHSLVEALPDVFPPPPHTQTIYLDESSSFETIT